MPQVCLISDSGAENPEGACNDPISASIWFGADEHSGSALGIRAHGDAAGVTGEKPAAGYEIEFFGRADGSEPVRKPGRRGRR